VKVLRPGRIVAAAALLGLVACSGSASGSAASTTSSPATSPSTAAAQSTTTRPRTSAGCTAAPLKPGVSEHTLTSGGVIRTYELHLPPSYDGSKPLPVVLGLHALTVSYQFVPVQIGFDAMEKTYDFIGVAPSGRLDGATPFWYAAPTADNYDVTFLGDLLDQLEATLCVDPAQVFSTGMSNGAQMSSLIACRMADRITAVAPVSGVEYLTPCTGKPDPILAFHGTADPILPYAGGGLNATRIADLQYWKGKVPPGLPKPLGVDESMRLWAEHNGCDPTPVETKVSPHVTKRAWTRCAARTELYVIAGAGHQWPGKPMPSFDKSFGPGTTEIDATTLMFRFFFGH